MKKALKWCGDVLKEFWIASVQAFWVSVHPYRTNRRLRVLQSQNFDLHHNNEELQAEIESLERRIKHLNKDLRQSWRDLAESRKHVTALKKFVLVVNRIEVPSRAGAIDELIRKRNEVQEIISTD